MKKKEMKKLIEGEISIENTDVNTIFATIFAMEPTQPVMPLMNAIKKALKEAGINTTTSNTALKAVRDELAESMPDIESYRDMRLLAVKLNDAHEVNDDTDKGVKSVLKAIESQLKEDSLPVPRKIHLGEVKALTVDYFIGSDEDGEATSVNGLADYLVANMEELQEGEVSQDIKDKLKITAGQHYNFARILFHHIRLDDIN